MSDEAPKSLLKTMWKHMRVTLTIQNRIDAGVPKGKNLIEGWIAANMPNVAEARRAELAEKTAAELGPAVEEKAEMMWTTFKRDSNGLYIESRQAKAMMKEAANILRDMLMKEEAAELKARAKAKEDEAEDADEEEDAGTAKPKGKGKAPKAIKSRFTNLKSRVAERAFVEGDKLYLMKEGKHVKEPTDSEERAIHVMTPQGPRDALKRVDFVEGPVEVQFNVRILNDGIVDGDLVMTLLAYAGIAGIGANRSQGSGIFEYKLETLKDYGPKAA